MPSGIAGVLHNGNYSWVHSKRRLSLAACPGFSEKGLPTRGWQLHGDGNGQVLHPVDQPLVRPERLSAPESKIFIWRPLRPSLSGGGSACLSPDKSDGARSCLAPPRFGSIRMLQRLFQHRQPGGGHLLVLLRGDPRNPDRPDELAIDHNRQSALDRNRVAQSQNGIAPAGDGVFEQLG